MFFLIGEHFKAAVESKDENLGTDRGLNTAESPRNDLNDQNGDNDVTGYDAMTYSEMQEDTNQDNLHLIPPRGLEPLLPG